jgi:lipoprotein-releasing system permease protein
MPENKKEFFWERWIALRYLMSKKSSRFLSFITLISTAGIAIGVMVMIVVLSVMDGFENELKKRLVQSDVNVMVTSQGKLPGTTAATTTMLSDLKKDADIQWMSPLYKKILMIRLANKITGIEFLGVSKERFLEIQKIVVESADVGTSTGVWLGQELAYQMGVLPGDDVDLISPTDSQGPMNASPVIRRVKVAGIYKSGISEQESHQVFSLDQDWKRVIRYTASDEAGDSIQGRSWEIKLKKWNLSEKKTDQWKKLYPMFDWKDWRELHAQLFSSLLLERIAMFIALAFIVVVASFNMVTTLTLMVLQKKKEIAILKAMGATARDCARIFMIEGLAIGLSGVSLGVVFGYLISILLSRYELVTLPDVYYDRVLPVSIRGDYYAIVAGVSIVVVLLSCWYPARRASALDPLQGLRS